MSTIDLWDYEGQVQGAAQTDTVRPMYTDNMATVPSSKVDFTMILLLDL